MWKKILVFIGVTAVLLVCGCGKNIHDETDQIGEEHKTAVTSEQEVQYFLAEEKQVTTKTDDGIDRTTIKVYNREGKVVEQKEYEDNYLIWRYVFEYGNIENCEEQFIYGGEAKEPVSKNELFYDERGNLVSAYYYRIEDSEYVLQDNYQYENVYDDQGNLLKIQEYCIINDVWEKNSRRECTYDQSGKLIKVCNFDSDDVMCYYWEYQYDAEGRLEYETSYWWDRYEERYSLEYELWNEFDENGDLLKQSVQIDSPSKNIILFTYDTHGNLIEKYEYQENGIGSETKWTYRYEVFDSEETPVLEKELSFTEETSFDEKSENMTNDWTEDVSDGLMFSTDYQIEDYCDGLMIVSKNERRLYGVLDIEGNEWIALQYDQISFLNKDHVINGKDDTLYLGLKYEDKYTVISRKKEIILKDVLGNVVCAEYSLGERREGYVAFAQNANTYGNRSVLLYDDKGELLLDIPWGESPFNFITMISENCFLVSVSNSNQTAYHVRLYNMEGEMLKEWEGTCMTNGENFLKYLEDDPDKAEILIGNFDGTYQFWKIDNQGNVQQVATYAQSELESIMHAAITSNQQNPLSVNDYSNDYFKLYKSNDTWKLETPNGAEMYEERYYECHAYPNYDGTYYDSFWLSNAENEAFMINRFGEKVIDYGWLTVEQYRGYWNLYFKGREFETSNCFVEDKGICYIDGQDVYYFQARENRK